MERKCLCEFSMLAGTFKKIEVGGGGEGEGVCVASCSLSSNEQHSHPKCFCHFLL